jgi:hypothetical protein
MSHAPPKRDRRSGQRAAQDQNRDDSTSSRVNHAPWDLAIGLFPETPARVYKSGSFAAHFAKCSHKSNAWLQGEHKRLDARIASRRTGIMALVAKRAAIETELARHTNC